MLPGRSPFRSAPLGPGPRKISRSKCLFCERDREVCFAKCFAFCGVSFYEILRNVLQHKMRNISQTIMTKKDKYLSTKSNQDICFLKKDMGNKENNTSHPEDVASKSRVSRVFGFGVWGVRSHYFWGCYVCATPKSAVPVGGFGGAKSPFLVSHYF